MKIIYAESEFWDNNELFIERYTHIIERTYKLARSKFPIITEHLTFVCQTNDWECISETGDGGFTRSSRLILLSLNPKLPHGEEKLLENVEATVLHEMNHAARYEHGIVHGKFLDNCIMEGLATVFEREYSSRGEPLWAKYDRNEINTWYKEIIDATNGQFSWKEYMYRHPDGRRWMGYKVGTWITDTAMQNSGRTIEELTLLSCGEIIKLAKL